jgi:hypothetical protein
MVGTARWVQRTSGRLTTADRRTLLRPLARTHVQNRVGPRWLALGVHPGRHAYGAADRLSPPSSALTRAAEQCARRILPVPLLNHAAREHPRDGFKGMFTEACQQEGARVPEGRARLLLRYGAFGAAIPLRPVRCLSPTKPPPGRPPAGAPSTSTLALLGVRDPQRMLPILLFEVSWKLAWLGLVAAPLWADTNLTGTTREQAGAVLWVVFIIAVIPSPHVARQFVLAPASGGADQPVANAHVAQSRGPPLSAAGSRAAFPARARADSVRTGPSQTAG